VPEEARRVIARIAAEQGASIIDASADARVSGSHLEGGTVTIDTPEDRFGPLSLALRGEHQVGNARVAVRLLEAARHRGVSVSRDAIERGLTQVDWPGRLELMRFEDGREVLLDAAHNVDGARALAAYLASRPTGRPALVIGVMRDKDVEGILAALLPVVSSVVATAAPTSRATPARDLAARIAAMCARVPVRVEPDPSSAVEQALATSSTVCVAGSIFVVGAVRDALRRRAILR
jgi:dihydrofolate synthase/folylpolyglutamate synthase